MCPPLPCPGCGGPSDDEYHDRPVEEGDRHSEAVVRAVAALTDRDALRLTPLGTVVDPDGIDHAVDGSRDASVSVAFEYEGCHVVVRPTLVSVAERTP